MVPFTVAVSDAKSLPSPIAGTLGLACAWAWERAMLLPANTDKATRPRRPKRRHMCFTSSSGVVVELRIPILALPFRRGVQHHPQRGRVGGASWVLAGVGGGAGHLTGPEVADRPVAT